MQIRERATIEVKGPKGNRSFKGGQRLTTFTIDCRRQRGHQSHHAAKSTARAPAVGHEPPQYGRKPCLPGVTAASKELEIQGVGYRAAMNGNTPAPEPGLSPVFDYVAPEKVVTSSAARNRPSCGRSLDEQLLSSRAKHSRLAQARALQGQRHPL